MEARQSGPEICVTVALINLPRFMHRVLFGDSQKLRRVLRNPQPFLSLYRRLSSLDRCFTTRQKHKSGLGLFPKNGEKRVDEVEIETAFDDGFNLRASTGFFVGESRGHFVSL